jgi:putative transposase
VPAKLPGASYMLQVEAGQAFAFDGRRFEISLVGDKNIVLTDSEGRQTEVKHGWLEEMFQTGRIYPEAIPGDDSRAMLSNYDEAELGQALRRRNCLSNESGASGRTLSRWRNLAVTAQVNGVNEVVALVPKTKLRGNRTSRLTQEQIDLIDKVIREHWLTAKAVSYTTCDKFLKDACTEAGITKPSYGACASNSPISVR